MADVLSALPFLSIEDYMWGYSASLIRLMAADKSHVKYLSQKQIEKRRKEKENKENAVFTAEDVAERLGMMGTAKAQPHLDWKSEIFAKQDEQKKLREKMGKKDNQ